MMEFSEREIELIDGMIEVQLDHANRCDTIANRVMAEKQKGWDLERVALLEKIKNTSATDPLLKQMAEALESLLYGVENCDRVENYRVEAAADALQAYRDHEQRSKADE